MAREDVEAVQSMFAAFNSGDYQRCFELIDPDVEWEDPRDMPGGGVHRGHDGVRKWFTRWMAAWDGFETDVEEIVDRGDQVIAVERLRAVGRTSRAPVDLVSVGGYTVRDGRITRRVHYPDLESALAAKGAAD